MSGETVTLTCHSRRDAGTDDGEVALVETTGDGTRRITASPLFLGNGFQLVTLRHHLSDDPATLDLVVSPSPDGVSGGVDVAMPYPRLLYRQQD